MSSFFLGRLQHYWLAEQEQGSDQRDGRQHAAGVEGAARQDALHRPQYVIVTSLSPSFQPLPSSHYISSFSSLENLLDLHVRVHVHVRVQVRVIYM